MVQIGGDDFWSCDSGMATVWVNGEEVDYNWGPRHVTTEVKLTKRSELRLLQARIDMTFDILVDSNGTVMVLDGQAKTYPSISIFSYQGSDITDLFEQKESGNPGDLTKPMRHIPGGDIAGGDFQGLNNLDNAHQCELYGGGACY